MTAKYHVQRNSKLGNVSGNAICGASGSRGGWFAVSMPYADWKELDHDQQCSKCVAKVAEIKAKKAQENK